MNILNYVRCLTRGKHSFTASLKKPGYETCTRCRYRREVRGIDVTSSSETRTG